MKTRAGKILAGALALSLGAPVAVVQAQELSEKAVASFMDYAWSLTPQQFSKPDGSTIIIDKTKRDQVMIPLDAAREVIKVGRLSAHAQVCNLADDQTANHHAMMRRESAKKWTPQQLVFISQLHLTTVMLLTGKIRLVERAEKEGEKDVVVDEGKEPPQQTCTEEQRKKVKELIAAYVTASPPVKNATASGEAPAGGAAPAAPAAAPAKAAEAADKTAPAKAAETTTGSTAAPAKAAPAAASPAPAAKK